MNSEIIVSEEKDPDFESFVHQGIKKFNDINSPFHLESRKPGAIVPLNIIVKDQKGRTVGGLAASSYWGWLDIEDFHLPEELRGSGLGSKILKMAEDLAAQRGCSRCHLTTYNIQAKDFYERRGYVVVGKLEDCPPGAIYYWMKKDFV
jgi:GNAT superfamily N-acetyltransferase